MHAVKFQDGSDTVIEGPGLPFGGPFAGRDLDRQYFSAKTDFAFDWYGGGARPALYHHGMDEDAGLSVIGRVKDWEVKPDLGVWTRVQLDKQSKYFAAIKDLVDKGALYFSSGAMAHLVKVNDKSGEILRWPWVELSLTPTPANLLATVDMATADKHYKAAGLELPDALKMAPAQMRQMMAEMASEMGMQMSEAEMTAMMADMDPDMPEPEMRAQMRQKMQARKRQTMDGEKAVVYEMLIAELQTRVNRYDPFGSGAQSTVEATLPGEAFVSRKTGDDITYWRVPYALLFDGSPELGESIEIQESDIPERDVKALPETSLATQADTVAHYAATLTERTKGLSERRTKEGRVLSMATRRRLSESLASMRSACDELTAYLDSTDPAKVEAKADLGRLLDDVELFELTTAL